MMLASAFRLPSAHMLGLLVGQGHYVHMGRRFRQGGSGITAHDLAAFCGVLVVVVVVAWLIVRYVKLRERRIANDPQALFRELCRAHGLDWASRRLLQSIVRAHRLAEPGLVFLDPERLDAEVLPDSFSNRDTQIAELRRRLFGTAEVE